MRAVSVAEAKARLSELINAVAFGGERVVIESRGRPKAVLVSVEDLARMEAAPEPSSSRAGRRLGLAEADRVREALGRLTLTDSLEDLARVREERLRERG